MAKKKLTPSAVVAPPAKQPFADYRYMQMPNSGIKPVVGIRGNKYAITVVNDELGVRCQQFDLREWDKADSVDLKGNKYPVERAARFLKEVGKRKAITLAAARVLARVLNEPEPSPVPAGHTDTDAPVGDTPPRSSILKSICEELKLAPSLARRILRASGMHAPYDNEAQIRSTLTNGRKPK